MKNIEENNKLIAEFMGYIDNGDPEYLIHPETNYDHSINDKEWFLYNTSWDWLMPVVEKIEPLVLNVSISKNGTNIMRFFENGNLPLDNPSFIITLNEAGIKNVNTKIEATYKAVVEFIKWYNENKED